MTLDAVIDTSALIEFFTGARLDPMLRRRVLTSRIGAPELVDIESVSTLRKMVRGGALTASDATETLEDLREAPIMRISHRALMTRAWELRDSLSAYDACYIALAEELDLPLLTCDSKLARSHGHDAAIELFPGS